MLSNFEFVPVSLSIHCVFTAPPLFIINRVFLKTLLLDHWLVVLLINVVCEPNLRWDMNMIASPGVCVCVCVWEGVCGVCVRGVCVVFVTVCVCVCVCDCVYVWMGGLCT
jgi:hypothetical protein